MLIDKNVHLKSGSESILVVKRYECQNYTKSCFIKLDCEIKYIYKQIFIKQNFDHSKLFIFMP